MYCFGDIKVREGRRKRTKVLVFLLEIVLFEGAKHGLDVLFSDSELSEEGGGLSGSGLELENEVANFLSLLAKVLYGVLEDLSALRVATSEGGFASSVGELLGLLGFRVLVLVMTRSIGVGGHVVLVVLLKFVKNVNVGDIDSRVELAEELDAFDNAAQILAGLLASHVISSQIPLLPVLENLVVSSLVLLGGISSGGTFRSGNNLLL